MAKQPAFLFYTQDFTIGTQFFSDAQTGQYIRLLCAQHQHGHLSEEQVKYICSTLDGTVMRKFIKDDNGLYYNERLDIEKNKRDSFCESRRENVKKRYDDLPESTSVEHMTQHMDNDNDILSSIPKIKEYIYSEFYDYQLQVAKEYVKKVPESRPYALEYYDFIQWLFNSGKYEKKDLLGNNESEKKKNLLRMPKQLKLVEHSKLVDMCKNGGVNLMEIFQSMEDYKLLNKKGTTVFGMAKTFVGNQIKK